MIIIIFYFDSPFISFLISQQPCLCRVAAVKSLPVHSISAVISYVLWRSLIMIRMYVNSTSKNYFCFNISACFKMGLQYPGQYGFGYCSITPRIYFLLFNFCIWRSVYMQEFYSQIPCQNSIMFSSTHCFLF
jgi:hypothetical protein